MVTEFGKPRLKLLIMLCIEQICFETDVKTFFVLILNFLYVLKIL